jgi:ABC-type antimicrobial peptide transport system permease subunit
VTLGQANSEMDALGGQLAREYPKFNEGKSAQAERLQDVMSESVRHSLWVLLSAVGFILLITCINVANMLLVRAAERQKELAVRLALGASRWRIVRQLLSESLLLAALGGAGGLLLGSWMLQGLLVLAPAEIPGLSRVSLDNRVLLFTLGLTALTHALPIDGTNWGSVFIAAGKPVPSSADLPMSGYIRVSANYFETMGIRLLRGRYFTAADTAESAPVVIINETLARRIWPNEDPVGKRIKQGFPEDKELWREVVGVVNDVKMDGVDQATSMQTYLPYPQMPNQTLGLIVRAERNPAALASAVEQAIHAIDKDVPVFGGWTMDQLGVNATDPLTFVLLAALLLVVALVACWIPARRATQVDPMIALRQE